MRGNFRLNRQIYFILGFVLLLTLVIQTTRLESILNIGGTVNGGISPSLDASISPLSDEEVALLDEEKILVLYDPEEVYSDRVMANTDRVLSYMKKKHDVVGIEQYQGTGESYDSIIMTFSDLEKLPNNSWMEQFVERGGRILFAAMPYVDSSFYRIYRKWGINELGDYVNSEGLVLNSNVLINFKDAEFSSTIVENTSLQLQLSKEANVHATAKDGLPLLWNIPYGKGAFVVFNGTMLQEKSSRGFLAGAISYLKEDNLYPIMNMKLMYIDDFPAPMPVGIQSDLFRIYKRSMSRFFKEVWWPDMIRAGSRYGLKYTGVVIQTYDDKTKAPFDQASESDNLNLVTFGRELLKRGGEIGIHGYNHQSLTNDPIAQEALGYKKWDSAASMEESVRTVVEFIRASLPNYSVHNYVPPSNVLSEEGREALKAGWPSLKSISSVYNEDPEQLSYVQEYEVAPDGIVELPRVTSGFKEDEYNEWAMVNAASSVGVFSHFIHPDDILDYERSFPYSWEELYKMFGEYMELVNDKYGWLRSMTATDASMEIERYTMSEPHFKHFTNRIEGYINNYTAGSLYYFLRTSRKITREENCRVTRVDDETYLIEVKKEHFVIGLGG